MGKKVEDRSFKWEWSLIKKDAFGNNLALKKLGNSPTVEVKIPSNYHKYALMLTLIDKDHSQATITELNAPVE